MWNEKFITYWSEQWDNAMAKTDNFCAEIRGKDEVNQYADSTAGVYDEAMGGDLSRVGVAIECIRRRGFMSPDMTALDIGSGSGGFTIPFAREYSSVTALDISKPMQTIIRGKAESSGINNIEYLLRDWHILDLEAEGLQKSFDLVLSSLNTRGICSLDTLIKMNRASKGGCCIVSFTGRGTKNHAAALNELVLGRQLESAGGNDIIMPFNLVYHMGGQPDMAYSSVKWRRELSPERAVEELCGHFWRFAEIDAAVKKKITAYVDSHLEENGMFIDSAEIPVGIMVWDARRVKMS